MANIEDSYLLQKLKEGDTLALEAIFNKHYADLCRYLFLLFKNQVIVENITQDIFVYLWENRKKIEITTSLESYLYSAGRYKALNQIRNKKRQEKIREQIGEVNYKNTIHPDTVLEIKELERIIEDAISSLPERCRQIFRLSREEDLSYKEIAKLLNISVNTVEGQMGIALKKLRANLRPLYLWLIFAV